MYLSRLLAILARVKFWADGRDTIVRAKLLTIRRRWARERERPAGVSNGFICCTVLLLLLLLLLSGTGRGGVS